MTKAEFVERVANRLNKRRKDAADCVEAVLDEIRLALQNGEKVQLIPFGSFEVRERAGREGRNPRTGEKIQIEARRVTVFTAGKALRDSLE